MGFENFAACWHQMEEQNKVAFASLWKSQWMRLPEGEFPFLQPDELNFLREVGLPDKAVYFHFEELEKGMPQVDQACSSPYEKSWTATNRAKVSDFRMLGSNGRGNPLVLDINSHELWLLHHENYTPLNFVNTGLAYFAETLLLFMPAMFEEPQIGFEELSKQLVALDPRAAQEGTFWYGFNDSLNGLM